MREKYYLPVTLDLSNFETIDPEKILNEINFHLQLIEKQQLTLIFKKIFNDYPDIQGVVISIKNDADSQDYNGGNYGFFKKNTIHINDILEHLDVGVYKSYAEELSEQISLKLIKKDNSNYGIAKIKQINDEISKMIKKNRFAFGLQIISGKMLMPGNVDKVLGKILFTKEEMGILERDKTGKKIETALSTIIEMPTIPSPKINKTKKL